MEKLDFRRAQLLYSRALQTVHAAGDGSVDGDGSAATGGGAVALAGAAQDLRTAWTHFVADREHLLEVVRHLARVTVVKTMKTRAKRAAGKASSSSSSSVSARAPALRTPRRATPARASTRASPVPTGGPCPPSPSSPRRLRRSPAAAGASGGLGAVRQPSATRRRLRFNDTTSAAPAIPAEPVRTIAGRRRRRGLGQGQGRRRRAKARAEARRVWLMLSGRVRASWIGYRHPRPRWH